MRGETSRSGLGAPLWVSERKMLPQSPDADFFFPPVFTELQERLLLPR